MSKSEFLKLQDKNNDGLLDECGTQPVVPEKPLCKGCVPNPNAIVLDWHSRGNDEPWLNEQTCQYQVTIRTSATATTPSATATDQEANEYMEQLFQEYREKAVESLLVNNNKEYSADAQEKVKANILFTKFDLDVRKSSRVLLLFSVATDVLDPLPEPIENQDKDQDEDTGGGTTVSFDAGTLNLKLLRIRKALLLYNRYYTIHRWINGGTLVMNTAKVFDLADYGDNGLWGKSVMSKILPELDAFLNSKGYDLPRNISATPGAGLFKKDIRTLTITFSNKFKIEKIEAYERGCPESVIFQGTDLNSLNNKSAFKDPTAMSYFSQLDGMYRAITSRVPMPWVDFLIKFTYPSIEEQFNYGVDEADNNKDKSAKSCVGDALKKEGKQLGLNFLDDNLGIGDAIAYQFNKNACKKDVEEAIKEEEDLGVRPPFKERVEKFKKAVGTVQDPNDPQKTQTIGAFAKEQAYKQLQSDQMSFEILCAQMIGLTESSTVSIEELFETTFDRIKFCGFQALLLDTIECLMAGLTLDKALGKLVEGALSAMSVENFGIFFAGLPAHKQAELNELVKKKLKDGKAFVNYGYAATPADTLAANDSAVSGPPSAQDPATAGMEPTRRTVAQQFDPKAAQSELDKSVIIQAYISAIIDEYSDDLLYLVDVLNEFPGAPIIAHIISALDCPRDPIFEPTVMEFVKDLQLPYCRSPKDIKMPVMKNPFGWFPAKADFSKAFFDAITKAIQRALLKVMIQTLVKTCQIFGSTMCKALEVTGQLAKSLALGDDNTFRDILRDTICGPNADDKQLNDTANDIFNTLGPGAASFANESDAMDFGSTVSASTTFDEMSNAFLGNCSDDFLTIVDTIIEYEFPQYREGLPTKEAICRFFTNVGNLMPADKKNDLANFNQRTPEDELTSANPTLCVTPEQQEYFCELRQELLKGRATPGQIKAMCDQMQDEMEDDLGPLVNALQKDNPFEDQAPQIVSNPGCDDGMIPFEAPEATATVVNTIMNNMEQLKVEYVKDMLGAGGFGPFNGDDDWGMLNLILSDTAGNPLTVHNKRAYRPLGGTMDYITNEKVSWADLAALAGAAFNPLALLFLFIKPMPTIFQKSALPTNVALWMKNYLDGPDAWGTFKATNDWIEKESEYVTFKKLGFTGFFGDDVDLTQIPDQGYNTQFIPHFGATLSLGGAEVAPPNSVEIVRLGRKKTPDFAALFLDNNKGRRGKDTPPDETIWDYGFQLEMYLSDRMEASNADKAKILANVTTNPDLSLPQKGSQIVNIPNNNVRIVINDYINKYAPGDLPSPFSYLNPFSDNGELAEEAANSIQGWFGRAPEPLIERKYEFFAVDDTLESLDFRQYPRLLETFQTDSQYPPQLILLQEMIENENNILIDMRDLESEYNAYNRALSSQVKNIVVNNDNAFEYGASFEDLTFDDFEYVMPYETDQTEPVPYDYDSDEKILGISKNQWQTENDPNLSHPEDTRIFYLSPVVHGGIFISYKRPPMYVRPLKNKGWMGFIDAIFPDFSQCADANTDLVELESIKQRVEQSYNNIPEDHRMQLRPQCAVEVPYFRILERSAKAGLEALISSTFQIFISTHFIKSIPIFSYLKPSFSDNYSNAYVSYMVEVMEASLKDAQGPFREFFNTFKDNEFWYAFLEQCVQLYSRLVADGTIVDVPPHIVAASTQINDMQSVYQYPTFQDLWEAIKLGDEPWYQIFNLPGFRSEKNLEAVQATEELAKLIMAELMKIELKTMSEKYTSNLEEIGLSPTYDKLGYWIVSDLCDTSGAGPSLNLKGKMTESVQDTDLETRTSPFYTNGGELFVSAKNDSQSLFEKGDDYIGYYHTHTNENNEKVFMEGKEHIPTAHNLLEPYANKVKIVDSTESLLGDIQNLNESTNPSKSFIIEKYISLEGVKMSPDEALQKIKQNDGHKNISELYPGTLEIIRSDDEEQRPIGLEGELGVRHGLRFSCILGGAQQTITEVEMDALDTSVEAFTVVEGSSKSLLCLIDKLIEDEKFRILTEYIFPINKFTALTAIYTDLALFPSIGQTIFESDNIEYPDEGFPNDDDNDYALGFDKKPGTHFDSAGYAAEVKGWDPNSGDLKPNPDDFIFTEGYEGWESYNSRKRGFFAQLAGVVEWDTWDQIILRKSKNTIKQMFKSYYYARDFKAGDPLSEERPSEVTIRSLKGFYLPQPSGKLIVPAHSRFRLRPDPFGKLGKPCQKKDE